MSGSVLYVDDDRNLCQIVAKALTSEGYAVRTCHDGEEALAVLGEYAPDLLLIDLMLPRRDGFDVVGELRKRDAAGCDLPVVVLTGASPTPAYAQRANELGALDLLAKPVPLEKLIDVVARAIATSKPPTEVRPTRETSARRRSASGTFDRVSFPALLHHLHGMRASGVLHLAHEKKRKWVQLREGYPVAVRSNLVRETLGRHLLRTGMIAKPVLEESRREAEKCSKRHGEILVAMDVLTEEQVAQALREQADEKFFEIFSWSNGTFRFERGAVVQRANALRMGRSPANLILEGVRGRFPLERIDLYFERHAGRFLAHGESPFYRFQDLHLDPENEALLRRVDGSRSLGSFRSEDERLRRTVYALLAAGLFELRATATVPTEARAARATSLPVLPAPHPLEERVAARAAAGGHDRRCDDPRQAELMELADQLRARDPHEVLGIDKGASEDEVKAAYERLAARAHPDRFSGGSQGLRALAEDVFGRVRGAYEAILDPRVRTLQQIESKKQDRAEKERLRSERAFQAEVECRKGEDAIAARSYESALVHFGKALELYPGEGDHHAHYGYALHLCHPGDAAIAAEAMEHVKRGLKLASHREKPYLYLGRLCKAVGRVNEAERMFVRAAQIDPECLEALRELRLIQMRREKSKGLIGRLFRR